MASGAAHADASASRCSAATTRRCTRASRSWRAPTTAPRCRCRWSGARDRRSGAAAAAAAVRLRRLRLPDGRVLLVVARCQPARPRRDLRDRARARRRRPRPHLVRRGQAGEEGQQLRRLRRLRAGAGRARLDGARQADRRGRQRRRPAGGGGGEPAAGAVPRGGRRSALRRRHQHHARRDAAADGRRVPRMGQPEAARRLRDDAPLLALRQPARAPPTRRCTCAPA